QRWRARSDAVLTGIGTLLADDPSLNVRAEALADWPAAGDTPPRQPLRVIVDSRLRTPATARTLTLPGHVLVATAAATDEGRAALRAAGAEVLEVSATGDGRVDLAALLSLLAAREINEVLVEAGATLAGALFAAGLVDELLLYVAPTLLGDMARGLVTLPGLERLADRVALRLDDTRNVGGDLRLTLSPAPPA
ncbi:MAG: RibD family protein, partial [Planctomycetes bacterium]|nr:RibD family protein [Planctomycetota bacterium]